MAEQEAAGAKLVVDTKLPAQGGTPESAEKGAEATAVSAGVTDKDKAAGTAQPVSGEGKHE